MRIWNLSPALLLVFVVTARAEEPAKDDTEQLFADLRSDEFSLREKAVHALSERAGKIWERLKKISEDDADPDVRTNAQIIMAAPTQHFFEAAGRSARNDLDELERSFAEQKIKYEATMKQLEEKRAGPAPERDTVEHKIADAGKTWEEFQKTASYKRNEDKTRLSIYAQIANMGLVLPPAELANWTPAKLPLEKRLRLKVSFDFVDCSLKDAMAFIEKNAGVKIEFGPGLAKAADSYPNVNLHVTDMTVNLALDWILKLSSASKTVDAEHEKIIVDSP